MNYQLKKYPKYKHSGIDWLGEIPEHWEVIKLKYALESLESGSRESGGGSIGAGIYSIGGEHIGWFGELLLENPKYISSEYFYNLKKGKIKTNDVLLVKDGATIGKCAIIKNLPFEKCAVNEHVFILRAKDKYNAFYLFYFIWGRIGQEQILLNVKGSAQPGLNSQFINDVIISLPPLPEQTAIANFLDDKTAKIDSLIEKKKKLIELYKEERTAVINHYVLGQHLIDNSQLTIDNGQLTIDNGQLTIDNGQLTIDNGQLTIDNEQLTINNYQLPKHWEVKKLKYVAKEKIQTGSTPPSNKEEYYKEEIDWFTPSDFSDDLLLLNSKRKISQLAIDDEVVKLYPSNTVLLVGIGATLGKVGYIVKKASSNQQINSISFDTLNKAKYYANFLFTNQPNIVSLANAATLAILNQSQTKDLIIPVPDEKDLTSIVQHIESETKRIDDKITRTEKEIELLQEYRTALINEVVTGKIKVIDN